MRWHTRVDPETSHLETGLKTIVTTIANEVQDMQLKIVSKIREFVAEDKEINVRLRAVERR